MIFKELIDSNVLSPNHEINITSNSQRVFRGYLHDLHPQIVSKFSHYHVNRISAGAGGLYIFISEHKKKFTKN